MLHLDIFFLRLILTLYVSVLLVSHLNAQRDFRELDVDHKKGLDTLAKLMSRNGIYERNIPLGFVSTPLKADSWSPDRIRPEHTYQYMVFSFDTVDISQPLEYIPGTVFISERYLERDYRQRKAFIGKDLKESVNGDKYGTHYYCKLYYDRKYQEYRVSIYPDYLVNICRDDIHFNRKCKDYNMHTSTISKLMRIPDYHYTDFVQGEHSNSLFFEIDPMFLNQFNIKNNLKTKLEKLLKELTSLNDTDFELKKRVNGRVNKIVHKINMSKHIKCFSFVNTDKIPEEILKQLKISFTKYSLSDDLLDHYQYTFDFVSWESLKGRVYESSVISDTSKYTLTENSWYKILTESELPDDLWVNDLKISETKQFYLKDDTLKIHLDQKERQFTYLNLKMKNIVDRIVYEEKKLNLKLSEHNDSLGRLIERNRELANDTLKLTKNLKQYETTLNEIESKFRKERANVSEKESSVSLYLESIPIFVNNFTAVIDSILTVKFDTIRIDSLLQESIGRLTMEQMGIDITNLLRKGIPIERDTVMRPETHRMDIKNRELEKLNNIRSNAVKNKENFNDLKNVAVKVQHYIDSIAKYRVYIRFISEQVSQKNIEIKSNDSKIETLKFEYENFNREHLISIQDSIRKWRKDSVDIDTEIGRLREGVQNSPVDQKWIYYKRVKKTDSLEVTENDFCQFWKENLNNRIPVRDGTPQRYGSYFYRGGVKEIYHIKYVKIKKDGDVKIRKDSTLVETRKQKKGREYVIDIDRSNGTSVEPEVRKSPIFIDREKGKRLQAAEVKRLEHENNYYYWIRFVEKN